MTSKKKNVINPKVDNKKFHYLDVSPTPVFIANSRGNYTYANNAACKMLGYTYEELTKLSINDIAFNPDDEYMSKWNEVLKIGHIKGSELTLKHKNGNVIYVLLDAVNISDQEIMGFAVDITERKKSEEKFSSILNTSIDGFCIVDQNGKILESNDAYEKMIGYSKSELTGGLGLFDIEVIEDATQISNHIQKVIKNGYDRFITKQRSKNGKIIDVEISTSFVPSLDNCFVVFVRNITDEQQNKELLYQNEKLLKQAQRTAVMGHYNLDFATEDWNSSEALDEIFEIDSSYNKNVEGWLQLIHPDYVDEMQSYLMNHVIKNRNPFDKEYMIVGFKSGKAKWVHGKGELTFSEDGSPKTMFGVIQDISEYKKVINEIEEQKEKFKNIIEATNVGTWEWNVQTNEVIFNERWANIIGYTLKELSPCSIDTWYRFVHPDDKGKGKNELEKHFAGKKDFYEFEVRMKHKDGSWVWVLDRGKVTSWTSDKKPLMMFGTHADITKQKLEEEKRRESNFRFSLAVQSAGIAVWEWDVENNILSWDDKMYELYEVDKDNFDGAYATWLSTLHDDDKARLQNEINLALAGKKDYNTEFKINLKDGSEKYLRAFAKTLRDEAGKATKMIGVNYEITELKKAQQEIIASEKRFRTVFKDSLAIMLIIDPGSMLIIDVNKAAESFYGYSREEFTKLKISDLNLNPVEMIYRDMRVTISNNGGRFEFKHRLANGEIRDVEVFSSPIIIDGKPHLNSIIHDITDRKKMENALKKSEEQYRNFFEHDLTGDYLTTVDGKFLECNDSLVKILGYNSRDELLTINTSEFYPQKSDRKEFLKLVRKQRVITDHVIKLKKKDETIITCVENCIGIFDEDDKLTRLQGYLFDITEQLKSTEALRESQQRFYSLFENMVEGFALHEVITDKNNDPIDYVFLDVNPSYEKLTGLKKEDIVGKKVTEVLPGIEKESANWIEKFGTVAITGEAISFEDYTKSIGKWYSITAYSPQKFQFAVIIEDITEDKKADEKIKFHAKLLEEIGESVIATNSEGKIIYWNHTSELLYGWNEADVMNKQLVDITSSNQSEEEAVKHMEKLQAGERWAGEMQLRKKNGEYFDAFVTDSPFFDDHNNLLGVIGISKDITDLKNVEKDLRERNKFIQTVLDNLPIGIALNQINDGRAQYMNKKFEEIYGWSKEEMKEVPEFFERIYPDVDYREEVANKIMSDINSGDPKRMYWENLKIKTKENETRIVNAQNIPLIDQNTMVSTVLDVTAVKNAEKILVESQRLSAIGEMSSAIAHDFNNSLQSILGNLDLSLIHMNENHPSKRYLEVIRTATTDAAERVKLLQRFAGRTKSKESYSELEVNQLLKDVIQQSRPLWKDSQEKRGLLFNIETEFTNVKKVLGNEAELRSVFYNCIKNCVEAMPNGGKITIKTYQKKESVKVLIVDEGIGMDSKTKDRLFQPFFSTKGFESGRGLGMSGAYSIIKEHGGNIYVKESSPNDGTKLVIELPQISKAKKSNNSEQITLSDVESASILWVDDDEMIRELAKEMMQLIGHKGKVVASGDEAIEELNKQRFDLVVTDIGMPGMNGWELVNRIKNEYDDEIKIAVLTGWGDQIGNDEKNLHQIKHIISKPFKVEQLQEFINSILAE